MATVSIIIPTYNGADRIVGALKSVLAQTYTDWELIVISDGSVDSTHNVVEQFSQADPRIILHKNHQNLGIQKSLNKGLQLCRGKYVARLDDDDMWVEEAKLATQVKFLEENQEYVLIGTDATVVTTESKKVSVNSMPKTDAEIRAKILSKNCFLHPTVMMRKSALQKTGGYSEEKRFLHVEDYELWLRLGAVGKIGNSDLISTELTVHADSVTSSNRVLQARNMMRAAYAHKESYPSFVSALILSVARYLFFIILGFIPLPKNWFYTIQRLYKKM